MIPTIAWVENEAAPAGAVRLLDQTRLPHAEVYLTLGDLDALCAAIARLSVRGAPALGIAGAYGLALAARRAARDDLRPAGLLAALEPARTQLCAVRPTAVNLAWGVARVWRRVESGAAAGQTAQALAGEALAEARTIHEEDLAMSRAMGRHGAALLVPGARVITHCNTGGLATGGLGTALAVVFAAAAAGKAPHVWVDETRPLLQGARLTTWELAREGIAATLLVDGAAAWAMARGRVDIALVGADRIAANGDAANKIGTYALAVAAARHRIPFYIVAPSSTFDLSLPAGAAIPVEERDAAEVAACHEAPVAPAGQAVWNPAFDVTPAELIAGWVTEHGVLKPPFRALGAQTRRIHQVDTPPADC